MILLPNGCSCSAPIINPSNWKTKKASIAKPWYIQYRFYDPLFRDQYPKGKFIVMKKGMNFITDLAQRQEVAKALLDATMKKLTELGYNPITGQSIAPVVYEYEIDPQTPVLDALEQAFHRLKNLEKHTKQDIKSVLKFVSISFKQLRYDGLSISQVTRKHMRIVLDNCNKTPARTNKYMAYLSVLFNELIELETIEHCPVDKIKRAKVFKKVRPTMTMDERKLVDEYLKEKNYNLWRFMHIFFHSGARITELFRLQAKDVDLKEGTINVVIKKGPHWTEKHKVIKDIAAPLWAEVMSEAMSPKDILFTDGLKPGSVSIHPDRINKLWKKYVKDPLGITADFYSLKHSHTTEIVEMISAREAAAHNSHTSDRMVNSVYDVNRGNRERKTVKTLNNSFS